MTIKLTLASTRLGDHDHSMESVFDIAKRTLALCFVCLILLGNLWISLAIFGANPPSWILDLMRAAAFFALISGSVHFAGVLFKRESSAVAEEGKDL